VSQPARGRRITATPPQRTNYLTKLCDERAPGVTDLPIDRIAQVVQPTAAQRAALDELKDASVKAAQRLKTECPAYQTLTPPGRVEAMEKRLDATLGTVKTVGPPLAKFYNSLSDEQKARFNSLRSSSIRDTKEKARPPSHRERRAYYGADAQASAIAS
jgi:LTXXQ motif family protein